MRPLSQDDARILDDKLMSSEYGFGLAQLMELAGLSIAESVHRFYPVETFPTVIVLCGPGHNGGDGLVAARHLSSFGYSVTAVVPRVNPALQVNM